MQLHFGDQLAEIDVLLRKKIRFSLSRRNLGIASIGMETQYDLCRHEAFHVIEAYLSSAYSLHLLAFREKQEDE